MAHILIDGYNLTGIAYGDLEQARNELIKNLQEYAVIKRHEITVVFDGWKNGRMDQTRTKAGHVTVIFSRLAENADTVIKKMLASSQRPWIVVSSDREIADYAFRRGFADISSDEFDEKLFRALHRKDIESIPDMQDDQDEEDYRHTPSRGNSRQLSKRRKRQIQALKKL